MTTMRGPRWGLMMGAGAMALAVATAAQAATPEEQAQDARIAKLEAAVASLESRVEQDSALEQQNAELKSEVGDLQAQVSDLKSQQTAQIAQIQTVQESVPPKPSALATIANGRPTIASADGKFTATLHGVMQLDTAAYAQSGAGPTSADFRRDGPALGASATNVDAAHARDLKDGDLFRRARIGIDGTAFGDWDYRFLFDFAGAGTENAGQVYETWVQYSGLKPFHFRVGAFSPSIGMEDQASTNGMPFLERSVDSDLSRGLAAGDTRTAAELFANGDHWLISGAVTGRVVGVINTGTAAAVPQSFGDQLGLVGRGVISPLSGPDWLVHFGIHGSYVVHPADSVGPGTNGQLTAASEVIAFSNTPELRVDGTKFINTGNIDATHAGTVGLEFAAQKANVLIQSEYDYFTVDRDDGTPANPIDNPHFQGYYVEGLWTLTGEQRRYNAQTGAFDAPSVAHPFSLSGGTWGALEVGVRYSDMNLNFEAGAPGTYVPGGPLPNSVIRGGEEQNITAGINWYLNPVVRFMLDYEYVHINRLSPATSANSASVWLLPAGAAGAGVQIGQNYSVVAVRSQVAF